MNFQPIFLMPGKKSYQIVYRTKSCTTFPNSWWRIEWINYFSKIFFIKFRLIDFQAFGLKFPYEVPHTARLVIQNEAKVFGYIHKVALQGTSSRNFSLTILIISKSEVPEEDFQVYFQSFFRKLSNASATSLYSLLRKLYNASVVSSGRQHPLIPPPASGWCDDRIIPHKHFWFVENLYLLIIKKVNIPRTFCNFARYYVIIINITNIRTWN